MTYLDGAYRLHRSEDVARFTQLAQNAFPLIADRIDCFGVDWLGRQFATDSGRVAGGFPQVLMLEPGTGEALEIPFSMQDFHDCELVEEPEAAVAYSFYQGWLTSGGGHPEYGQCVGYKQPLFLGGEDEVTNLAIVDLDVYWTLTAQLLRQVRASPAGTRVRSISISDWSLS